MKLYWRIKKNGKWTWKAATVDRVFGTMNGAQYVVVMEMPGVSLQEGKE